MNNLNYFDASSSNTDIERRKHFVFNIIGVNKADHNTYEEALELFTNAIRLNPKDAVAFFNRATIEMQLGRLKEARKDFKESEKLDVNNGYE